MEYLVTVRDEQDQYNVNVTFLMEVPFWHGEQLYVSDVVSALETLDKKWEGHVVPIQEYQRAINLLLSHYSINECIIQSRREVGRYMKSLSIRVPEKVKVY